MMEALVTKRHYLICMSCLTRFFSSVVKIFSMDKNEHIHLLVSLIVKVLSFVTLKHLSWLCLFIVYKLRQAHG